MQRAFTSERCNRKGDFGYLRATINGWNAAARSIPFIVLISRIVQALAANTLDLKRAGILLYGLQIAAQNQPKTTPNIYNTVTEVGQTEDGIDVALVPPNESAKESFPRLAERLRLNLRQLEEVETGAELTSARARKSIRAK